MSDGSNQSGRKARKRFGNRPWHVCAAAAAFLWASPSTAAFRDRGWGVRGLGMGRAFAAGSDDAASVFWNPAGAARVKGGEASFLWRDEVPGLSGIDIVSGSAVSVRSSPIGVFGVAATVFDADGLSRETTYIAHYALSLGRRVAAGVNYKYLRHDFDTSADAAAAANPAFAGGAMKGASTADAGLKITPARWIALGFAGRSVTRPDVGLASIDRVPAEYQVGVALRLFPGFTLEIDEIIRAGSPAPRTDKVNAAVGMEQIFFARSITPAALRLGGNRREASAGVTIKPDLPGMKMGFDYAYVLPLRGSDAGGAHHMGLSLYFGGAAEPPPAKTVRRQPPPRREPKPAVIPPAPELPAPPPAVEPKAAPLQTESAPAKPKPALKKLPARRKVSAVKRKKKRAGPASPTAKPASPTVKPKRIRPMAD